MSKGFIRQSSSLLATLVLLAEKRDGGSQFWINQQDINSKTIQNGYPLPMAQEMLNFHRIAQIDTKVDV